ncbi:MAG TPA: hypothetical protein VMU29_12025 [Smithella sp.]|nr:hypothetical protein [Smithella sp.]
MVGEKPTFINDKIIHIPAQDGSYKETNIFNKLILACKNPAISDYFLFVNDDHFFAKDFDIDRIPYWHGPLLQESLHKRGLQDNYWYSIRNTIDALKDKNKLNFDVHYPIIFNKYQFSKLESAYDWSVMFGYLIKSLYCNHYHIPGIQTKDNKINEFSGDKIEWDIFSTSVHVNTSVKQKLSEMFPDPSPWELR